MSVSEVHLLSPSPARSIVKVRDLWPDLINVSRELAPILTPGLHYYLPPGTTYTDEQVKSAVLETFETTGRPAGIKAVVNLDVPYMTLADLELAQELGYNPICTKLGTSVIWGDGVVSRVFQTGTSVVGLKIVMFQALVKHVCDSQVSYNDSDQQRFLGHTQLVDVLNDLHTDLHTDLEWVSTGDGVYEYQARFGFNIVSILRRPELVFAPDCTGVLPYLFGPNHLLH